MLQFASPSQDWPIQRLAKIQPYGVRVAIETPVATAFGDILDANQVWDLSAVRDLLQILEGPGFAWLEEPMASIVDGPVRFTDAPGLGRGRNHASKMRLVKVCAQISERVTPAATGASHYAARGLIMALWIGH